MVIPSNSIPFHTKTPTSDAIALALNQSQPAPKDGPCLDQSCRLTSTRDSKLKQNQSCVPPKVCTYSLADQGLFWSKKAVAQQFQNAVLSRICLATLHTKHLKKNTHDLRIWVMHGHAECLDPCDRTLPWPL